jgi:hypothetical protein
MGPEVFMAVEVGGKKYSEAIMSCELVKIYERFGDQLCSDSDYGDIDGP